MRKIFFIAALFLLFAIVPLAYAQNSFKPAKTFGARTASESSNRKVFPSVTAKNDSTKIEDLKKRADHEIERRVEALNKLILKINGLKKLSQDQKSSLTSQVQTQINGLNSLKTKIDAGTDLTVLRTDVKSIVTDYRIYVFFIQDINLLSTAGRLQTTLDNLTTLASKLQTRIDEAKTKGENVDTQTAKLSEMQAKIADAKTKVSEVNSALAGLTASGYPGNKTILESSRTKLKQAFTDIGTAYADALQIIKSLRILIVKPTITPTP